MSDQEELNQRMLDHSWRYFELHAGQRMTLFNYFLALSGVALAGLAACLQGARYLWPIGAALGMGLTIIASVFWKLDQRTSFLVKHAEKAVVQLEREFPENSARLITSESSATLAANGTRGRWSRIWTYGASFRFAFALMAVFGLAGAALCGARITGWVRDADGTEKTLKVECIVPSFADGGRGP
jgi:hypothetical protein